MGDRTLDFFNDYLPKKLANGITGANGIYVFDIDGAGTWTLDLDGKTLNEGGHESPGCTIKAKQADWNTLLESPGKAPQLVMMGKVKISNLSMGMKLQNILA